MGLPKKGFMVRLPRGEVTARFEELCRHFRGLPPTTVLKMLVSDALSLPHEQQVTAINRQIQGGNAVQGTNESSTKISRNSNRMRSARQ